MKPIPEDELSSIRDNFEFADTDGNGLIDFKEFSRLLRILAPDTSVQSAAEGFSMIDTNCDGQIDFEEFISWWKTVWYEF